ncbi:hypothetical protein [Leucobacter iarius]|uniref:Htaa protein n=1 Tax=Leucobacter iarius TaxID=333963 RepID=A0ABP4XFL5_9MICO
MTAIPVPSPRARSRTLPTKLAATLLGIALLLLGAVAPTAARAADAWLDRLAISVLFDGAQVPNAVDDAPKNGIVATNDAVAFQWDLAVTGTAGGSLTQTLPEGWRWDPASLGALDTDGRAYAAHHVLSEDGRTLTATVTQVDGKLLSLAGMKAIPSRTVADESTYLPVVSTQNGGEALEARTGAITVRGEHRAEFEKTVAAHNISGRHDFSDGSGLVDARAIDFVLRVRPVPEKEVGVLQFELAQPASIRDTFTITGPTGASKLRFQAEIIRQSAGSHPTLQQSGNTLDITLNDYASLPGTVADGNWNRATVAIRFWVRAADLPTAGNNRVVVWNTAAPQQWQTTDGDPVAVTSESKISGYVELPQTGRGDAATDKRILVQKDPQASPALTADPAGLTDRYEWADEAPVSTDSIIVPRWWVQPGADKTTGSMSPISDLVSYDFWHPAEQRILEGAMPYVGVDRGTAPLNPSDYAIQYTSGNDRTDPERNTWVSSIAAAGGPERVSGIRVAYTAGAWASTAATQKAFVVAVPMRLVAKVAEANLVPDVAAHAYTDADGGAHFALDESWIEVRDLRVRLGKNAARGTVVGGASIDYTLTPELIANTGDPQQRDVHGIRIVDELPAGLVSVDTSAIPDDWEVERVGSAAAGLTLILTYRGEATTAAKLEPLRYSAKTSLVAPVDTTYVNTAVLEAQGADPDRAQATVSYLRAQVVGTEKTVAGDEEIEPGGSPEWETSWFNLQTDSQRVSHFVDVLPYNGDGRGSSFTGAVSVASARITDGQGTPAPDGYGTLQVTTAPAAQVRAAAANSDAIEWIDADGTELSKIAGITALRVVVADFAQGDAGFGGLHVVLSNPDHLDGDRYVNTTGAWLGAGGRISETNPAEVRVVAAEEPGPDDVDAGADADEADVESGANSGAAAEVESSTASDATNSASSDPSSMTDSTARAGSDADASTGANADQSSSAATNANSSANAGTDPGAAAERTATASATGASASANGGLARTGAASVGLLWAGAAGLLAVGLAVLVLRLRARHGARATGE